MGISSSLLQELRKAVPTLRLQIYFKASLTALSHAIEDLVLAGTTDRPLVIANFQQERFYRQEMRRYEKIAKHTDQIYVLATFEPDFTATSTPYIKIPLHPDDELAQEWHVIVIGESYAACLVCREHAAPIEAASIDQARQFQGFWTFNRELSIQAAKLLLEQIAVELPELNFQIQQTIQRYGLTKTSGAQIRTTQVSDIDIKLFAERLVTYLQSSQYKLIKAYRAIAAQEQRERLINSITTTIRRSLNPEDVLTFAVRELGDIFTNCRCLLYRRPGTEQPHTVEYEAVPHGCPSLKGEVWCLAEHPLFQSVATQEGAIAIADVNQDTGIRQYPELKAAFGQWQIRACLLVPIRYQENWLGMLELHHCGGEPYLWRKEDIALIEAIATQVGVALMQAQAYTNLKTLNAQLVELDRAQTNLIAIVGHELRTPLATIQICLESLDSEPQTLDEMQQVMLQMAIQDAERMRRLIQDFLTLSRLESGSLHWHLEPISLLECIELSLCSLKAYKSVAKLPNIVLNLPNSLPLLKADGEGLTQVLSRLLENACKFTESTGTVTIEVQILSHLVIENQPIIGVTPPETNSKIIQMIEVIITDTGRGIEPSRLEAIFERFYQEEGFMRRTAGGVGLGLAISRRIIERMGGRIWATSQGKNQGSQFHFTVPIASGLS